MVYLHNITTPQVVFIPRNVSVSGSFSFRLRSTVNLDGLDGVTVEGVQETAGYYRLEVILPADVTPGEYEYTLRAGEETAATGLLIIPEPMPPTEYNHNASYTQYVAH